MLKNSLIICSLFGMKLPNDGADGLPKDGFD